MSMLLSAKSALMRPVFLSTDRIFVVAIVDSCECLCVVASAVEAGRVCSMIVGVVAVCGEVGGVIVNVVSGGW